MLKATLIIGLPGSGKTHLGQSLSSNFIDDPKEKPIPYGENLVIADPNFCISRVRDEAIKYIQEYGYQVECIYFENNPEQCKENVMNRNDGRKVMLTIDYYSGLYNIPSGIIPRKVWQI